MNLRNFFRRFWRYIKRENFHRLFLAIAVLLLVSAFAVTLMEPGLTFLDAVWWSIVTLTTVGYGDISPATPGGRLVAVVLMVMGIGLLGTLSASIAGFLIEKRLKEDRGMSAYDFEGHIILCEWNHRTRVILNEFRADTHTAEAPIVLIANVDGKPVDDDNLHFVRGSVTDETLKRANLAKAKTVVILGDDSLEDMARDAKVVLSALAVESINPNTYTIVELVDESNVPHCRRANADEIIVVTELSSNLMARAALNHGITKVVSEVLSSRHGNELYKIPALPSMIGHQFIEAFTHMKQVHQSIILAVQKGTDGEVISNPPGDYPLENDDYLIVLAAEKPGAG